MKEGVMDKLTCFFLGHKYRVVQHFSREARRVKCSRCKDEWAMYDPTKAFVPLDAEIESFYASQGHVIKEPIYGYKEAIK